MIEIELTQLLLGLNSESGGDDGLHGNQTIMENAFNEGDADWEITRYSGVVHGYTVWDSANAYSPVADARSWEAMFGVFEERMAVPVPVMDSPSMDSPSDSPVESPSDSSTTSADSGAMSSTWNLFAAFGVVVVAMLV